MNFRSIGLIILIAGLGGDVCRAQLAAQSNCDPSLTKLSNGPLGYKDRGDRCEGIYIKEVGSTSLQLASFTQVFGAYNVQNGKPILIEWNKIPGASDMHLRAQGLKRKLYYRMDSDQPNSRTSFSWPTNLLASLGIVKNDIGILAFTPLMIGDAKKNVFIPLNINKDKKTNNNKNEYSLLLMPGIEMKEIYVSIAPVAADGKLQKFIKDGEPLNYGYYPAERPINIPVSGLKTSGIYYLEIGASFRNGGSSTLPFYFYHP